MTALHGDGAQVPGPDPRRVVLRVDGMHVLIVDHDRGSDVPPVPGARSHVERDGLPGWRFTTNSETTPSSSSVAATSSTGTDPYLDVSIVGAP